MDLFLEEQYIHESPRNTQDIIDYIKKNNKTGMMVLVDFKKAFDSISHKYIYKVLAEFRFGEYIIRWVTILIGNYYVSTMNDGTKQSWWCRSWKLGKLQMF